MKKWLALSAFAFVVLALTAGQATVVDSKDSMALRFSVNGLGNFGVGGVPVESLNTTGPATGFGAGGQLFIGDGLALGVDLYLQSSSDTDNAGNKDSDFRLSLCPSLRKTLIAKGPLALRAGGYLSFGLYSNDYEQSNTSFSGQVFGFGGIAGVEYFVLPGISLGTAYSLGASFMSGTRTNAGIDTDLKTSSFGIDSLGVYLNFYL